MKIVSCILRNTGQGWYILDVGKHAPVGVASVEQFSDLLRLHYNFTAQTIGAVLATADETYILQDIICGCSMNAGYTDIYFKKVGQGGYVDPATLSAEFGNINVLGFFT